MGVATRHILQQGPVLGALGRTALSAVQQNLSAKGWVPPPEPVTAPGPVIERDLPALPQDLLDDFVRFLGGDPRSYRGQVPPHLFPQWSFPVAAKTLEGVPYPMLKVVNGGCKMERHGPIPVGQPLVVRGQLTEIDDDGTRALLTQRVTSGTADQPELLVAEIHAFVPLKRPERKGPPKPKPSVPVDARELSRFRLGLDAGLSFAKLTGDFNPIHWVPAYAKASGFKNTILHGFGTFAFAAEHLVRHLFAGDPQKLAGMEARFTRPLVLPADVGVYLLDDQIFVGAAHGGPAYMVGSFAQR